jgi:hypothetical protein
MQLQEPTPFLSLQMAFDAHGEGLQGLGSGCTTTIFHGKGERERE